MLVSSESSCIQNRCGSVDVVSRSSETDVPHTGPSVWTRLSTTVQLSTVGTQSVPRSVFRRIRAVSGHVDTGRCKLGVNYMR